MDEMETGQSEHMQAEEGRASGGDKSPGGSVKRAREKARERAAAGLLRENPLPASIIPPSSSHSSSQSSPREGTVNGHPVQPKLTNGKTGQPANRRGPKSPDSSPRQRQAPQRPSRPNFVPPLPNGNSSGDNPPPINPRRARNYWEDGYGHSSGEFSSTSRPSTTATGSSTASIPDFPTIPSMPSMPSTPVAPPVPPVPPIPQMPVPTYQPPRRNLGPPPSARRGASSYYSQNSFVPPIPEEMSDAHSSYASSHVIPMWENGPPEYYVGAGISEEDEEVSTTGGDSGRESRAGDHTEESNLVKKGTPEKTFQPYMDTLESGDESDRSGPERRTRELDWQAKQDERWQGGNTGGVDPIGRHNFRNNGTLQHHPYSGYESDATFLDSPRSNSPTRTFQSSNKSNPYLNGPSPAASPIDPRMGAIIGHLEKGGALPSGTATPRAPSMSEKGLKRPPRLNLDATKDGRGGGSASSLPELIRRATKLASNLDRGRTASRVGMLDLLNANEKEKRARQEKEGQRSKTGSISDILAAFPSPSPTTSTHQKRSNWSSPTPHGRSNLSRTHTVTYGSSRSEKPRGRRCCGMPLWAFILLLIILLLLVIAAVVIPVTLVVLPRQSSSSGNPSVDSCKKSSSCQNGGSSLVISKQCGCICVNGWTGSTCTTSPASDGSCTTADIPGSSSTTYHNATLGSSIPRLLSAAQSNFSIPLSGASIASLFSQTNLSCFSENAFVTFNQKAQRRSLGFNDQEPLPLDLAQLLDEYDIDENDLKNSDIPDLLHVPSRTSASDLQEPPTHILHARASAQTSNNIIFAPSGNGNSGNGGSSPSGMSGPLTTATSTASASSPSASGSGGTTPVTQQVLDFARTAVLFTLQETDSETATKTLDQLRLILGSAASYDPTMTSVAGNVTVDLGALSVRFANGSAFGPNIRNSRPRYMKRYLFF